MQKTKIAIIGAGHIGKAIYSGLIRSKKYVQKDFILTDSKSKNKNIDAVKSSDIIIISVRPFVVSEVIKQIKQFMTDHKLVVSVAACVPIPLLEGYFGIANLKIARIMPNIPVSYGNGIVGLGVNKYFTEKDKLFLEGLFSLLGKVVFCKDDKSIEKLSMISGCGTGYVSYFMDNLSKIALKYGFSQKDAYEMVLSTFSGTVQHIVKTKQSFENVIASIATKGGITEEVINSMNRGNFFDLFKKSIDSGYTKIGKITEEL